MTDMIDSLTDAEYEMGLDFHWGVWTPDTTLTLVNVPWNNDYRDIWKSPTGHAGLDAWIDSHPNLIIHNMSYVPFGSNVRIDTPFNAAQKYNYLRASNPLQPGVVGDIQTTYYYFILGVNNIAPGTTELILQLDVWQTFGYDVTFGSCFVERGHIGVANSHAFDHYGRDYLSEPEGLDVGGEYRTVHVASRTIMAADDTGSGYHVLVCSTIDLTQDPGAFGSSTNPKTISAKGSVLQGLTSGASFYIFTMDGFRTWLSQMQNIPWVTQGIVSVTLIPKITRYEPSYTFVDVSPTGVQGFYQAPTDQVDPKLTVLATGWRDSQFITNILGARYAGLKKFLTYPYLVLELTTWTGSPVIIKPEMWQDADATVKEIISYVPPGQRIAIMPLKYNADAETDITTSADAASGTLKDDFGEFLDMAAIISNFPTVPIVNNMAAEFLAANRNGIAFQYRSADWSQQRALAGAQAGASNAGAGIANMGRQSAIGNQQTVAQMQNQVNAMAGHAAVGAISAALGAVGGGTVAKASQGILKGAGSSVDSLIGMNQTVESANIQTATRGAGAVSNIQAAGQVRDTNLGYANFAARGDYANDVAGIQAKIQDAQMTQPSVSGQFGGDTFNFVNQHFGFSLRWKMPNLNVLRSIGDFWLRYGYSVRQFAAIPATLQCMSKFTYWKLTETYLISTGMPESFKQTIRGIFEKGVTVWNSPDDIGVIDWAANQPLTNISL